MTKDEIADVTRLALGDRLRAAVKAVLEQVIEEEMTERRGNDRTRRGEVSGKE